MSKVSGSNSGSRSIVGAALLIISIPYLIFVIGSILLAVLQGSAYSLPLGLPIFLLNASIAVIGYHLMVRQDTSSPPISTISMAKRSKKSGVSAVLMATAPLVLLWGWRIFETFGKQITEESSWGGLLFFISSLFYIGLLIPIMTWAALTNNEWLASVLNVVVSIIAGIVLLLVAILILMSGVR